MRMKGERCNGREGQEVGRSFSTSCNNFQHYLFESCMSSPSGVHIPVLDSLVNPRVPTPIWIPEGPYTPTDPYSITPTPTVGIRCLQCELSVKRLERLVQLLLRLGAWDQRFPFHPCHTMEDCVEHWIGASCCNSFFWLLVLWV